MNEDGEPNLQVIADAKNNPIALIYFEDFQGQEKDILQLDISSVVLGDISEPGCFVDWASFSALLEKKIMDQAA